MMKRCIVGLALVAGGAPSAALAQTCIDFQQDSALLEDLDASCGPYVDPVDPGPGEGYAIQFALPCGEAIQARVYYSTDGSAPAGSLGAAGESSQVATAKLSCSLDNGLNVFEASIPALEVGTSVRFILSAWKEGGAENFLAMPNDGGAGCSAASSSQARVFEYVVTEASPRPVPDVVMVALDTPRVLSASAGLMANDRFVTTETTLVGNGGEWAGHLTVQPDGSLVFIPTPGYLGDGGGFNYQLEVASKEYASSPATVHFVIRAPNALVSIGDEPSGAHCSAGGKRIDVGIDNGLGGTIPFDGKLDPPEVTGTSYACNGAPGTPGSGGGSGGVALVRTSSEPAGANCAKGGQKVEAGVDANGDGVLDGPEVTSTAFICTGATGKSGCGAASGELSGLSALAPLAWLGLRRRRSGEEDRR